MTKNDQRGTATINIPAKDRHVPKVGAVSDGTLAGSVLELAQTLTKNNAVLKERTEERARLSKILGEFKTHLAWQAQRQQQLKRNLERLHNETQWLNTKGDEVKQDTHVISHELRQAAGELDKLRASRDARKLELDTVQQELKLEKDAVSAVNRARRLARLPRPSCDRAAHSRTKLTRARALVAQSWSRRRTRRCWRTRASATRGSRRLTARRRRRASSRTGWRRWHTR